MSRPLWFAELLKAVYPGRFLFAGCTRLPVVGSVLHHLFFADDDAIYLPRDRVIQINQAIESPENVVLPSQILEHFIQESSHRWIMNTCLCRDATQCKDYPIDLGCLFMGEATQDINPALGRPVTKEEAMEHVRHCQDAGLVHMVGRNRVDTVWMGVGPGSKLLTVCNCCPCCCLWGILPYASRQTGANITKMPGLTVTVTDDCIGCGLCTQGICFMDAISVVDERAVINDACRGCGQCVDVCPQQAIEIRMEDSQYLEQSIRRLSGSVDVS